MMKRSFVGALLAAVGITNRESPESPAFNLFARGSGPSSPRTYRGGGMIHVRMGRETSDGVMHLSRGVQYEMSPTGWRRIGKLSRIQRWAKRADRLAEVKARAL